MILAAHGKIVSDLLVCRPNRLHIGLSELGNRRILLVIQGSKPIKMNTTRMLSPAAKFPSSWSARYEVKVLRQRDTGERTKEEMIFDQATTGIFFTARAQSKGWLFEIL